MLYVNEGHRGVDRKSNVGSEDPGRARWAKPGSRGIEEMPEESHTGNTAINVLGQL